MAATRKKQASPAQIAARKAFAERARSGGFARRKKVATSGAKVKRRATKAPSPAQLAARAKFVAMVRARAKGKKRRNVAGDSSVKSPTRTSSDVRSPTRTATSTEAQTSGNVTVTGGAGRGATTRVSIHTAAPRGTKAKVGKRANSRGFSGRTPGWIRNKKAKRNGVLLTNGRMRAACRRLALRANPGRVRFTEAELAKYAPHIKGLSGMGSVAPSRSFSAPRAPRAPRKKAGRKFKKVGVFGGSGFLGLGRSRKTVRANKGRRKTYGFADRGPEGRQFRKESKRGVRLRKTAAAAVKMKRPVSVTRKSSRWMRLPNPSPASVFSEFRGKDVTSKSKATFHGNETGAVAQLGALRELKLIGKKLEFGGHAVLCADGHKKLHIGGVRFKATGVEEDMGEVRSVTYRSSKPHIETGTFDYVHHFGEDGGKPPLLVIDAEGYPFFEGGSYKISEDGIIN